MKWWESELSEMTNSMYNYHRCNATSPVVPSVCVCVCVCVCVKMTSSIGLALYLDLTLDSCFGLVSHHQQCWVWSSGESTSEHKGLCSAPCLWMQAEQDHYTGLCGNHDNKRPQNKREALANCQGLGKPYSWPGCKNPVCQNDILHWVNTPTLCVCVCVCVRACVRGCMCVFLSFISTDQLRPVRFHQELPLEYTFNCLKVTEQNVTSTFQPAVLKGLHLTRSTQQTGTEVTRSTQQKATDVYVCTAVRCELINMTGMLISFAQVLQTSSVKKVAVSQ